MANSLQRIWNHRCGLRGTLAPLCRSFSADSLVQVKPGEIGMVSGIPEEHLTRRVYPRHPFSVLFIYEFLIAYILVYFRGIGFMDGIDDFWGLGFFFFPTRVVFIFIFMNGLQRLNPSGVYLLVLFPNVVG